MPIVRALSVLAAALLAAVPALAARPNPHADIECSFCHLDTPTIGVDTAETVTFWRAERDEPKLCERCHQPEENFHPLFVTPGPDRLGTRRPTRLPLGAGETVKDQVVCTTCHFLHAPDADHALLRGFTGPERSLLFREWQDLCRECHGDGLAKRSPHAGDDRSCAFCHAAKPQLGAPIPVTPQGRRLCEFCHGRLGPEHYAGVNPFSAPQDCTGCHDPHLGKDHPARLKAGYFDPIRESVAVNPHRRRTLCFACHPDEPATARLRSASPVALCQRCHGSGEIPGMSHPLVKAPPGLTVPAGWPLADGVITCLTCHRPGHVGEDPALPHLLRGGTPGDRTAVCFECHRRDQWQGNPHRQVAQEGTGCEACHAKKPVWGKNEPQEIVFRADVNIVCLTCHDPPAHPGGVEHTMTLAEGMPRPKADLPLGTGNRITCATCHNPHLDRKDGHNLRGIKAPVAFCSSCHSLAGGY